MRKPKPVSTTDEAPPPAGGRALGRARQFALSRGLPEPAPAVDKQPPKARKPAATPAASKPRKPIDR